MNLEERRSVYIGNLVSSSISGISCSILLYIYATSPTLHSFSFKIIIHLVFYDFLHCVVFILPTFYMDINHPLCLIQAFLVSVVTLMCVFWTFVIGFCLYISTSKYENVLKKWFRWLVFWTWILSFVGGIAPFFGDAYGDNIGWCWIKQEEYLYRFILFSLPLWTTIIANCIFYILIIKKISNTFARVQEAENIDELLHKLKIYPIVSIICFLPITSYRLYEYYNGDNYVFVMCGGIILCLNGFFNTVIYGLNKHVRNIIKSKIYSKTRSSKSVELDSSLYIY